MGNCNFSSRSEAIVVSGGCCLPKTEKARAVSGKWKCIWTWAGLSKVERLQMGVLDFDWTFTDVTTAEQDSLTASAAVVVQVMQDIAHFHKASDIFLGKTKEEIGKILFPVVERHVRLIYGQEKLEQILAAAETENYLSVKLQKSVALDLWDMGMMAHKILVTDVEVAAERENANGNGGNTQTDERLL